jgi:hypothetical protein
MGTRCGHHVLDIELPFLGYEGQISKAASETKPLTQVLSR